MSTSAIAGTRWRLFIGLSALVTLAWVAYGAALLFLPYFTTDQQRGLFGDMFGALNTLFSGLAFAGVIYAVHLQTLELALQRQELEQTRDELRRSSDAQEQTSRALRQQLFLAALTASIQASAALLERLPPQSVGAEEQEARISARQRTLDQVLAEGIG